MKFILQILFFFLTWFTNLNATPVFTKVALPSYAVSFSKTENIKEESVIKIGVQNFARSGISENAISEINTSRASYALVVALRAGEVPALRWLHRSRGVSASFTRYSIILTLYY
jgi:hypothetical protein